MLIAGLLFARCNMEILDIVQPEKKRLRESVGALPAISVYPGETALVSGSSLVWNGFVPEVFDAGLADHGVDPADHVEVISMPVNHAWIERTAAAQQRIGAVAERIERETNLRVVDFESILKIDPELFFDVTHLSPLTGGRVFSAHLAEHNARGLAPGALP